MENKFKITEFKNEQGHVYFELGYDPTTNWGLTNWIGYLPVEYIKTGAEAMIDLIKKHNIKNWLDDNREIEGAWDEANDWIASSWMPRAIEAGLRKFAIIVPDDIFSQVSSDFMADNAKGTALDMINWKTEDEARNWLAEN